MKATIKGAVIALTLATGVGCTTQGLQAPKETPRPSTSPEIQVIVDLVSPTKKELLAGAARYDQDYCEVHLGRLQETPGFLDCDKLRRQLGGLAGRLEEDLRRQQPVPVELDKLVSGTSKAMLAVQTYTDPGDDPAMLTFALGLARDVLEAWESIGG